MIEHYKNGKLVGYFDNGRYIDESEVTMYRCIRENLESEARYRDAATTRANELRKIREEMREEEYDFAMLVIVSLLFVLVAIGIGRVT